MCDDLSKSSLCLALLLLFCSLWELLEGGASRVAFLPAHLALGLHKGIKACLSGSFSLSQLGLQQPSQASLLVFYTI